MLLVFFINFLLFFNKESFLNNPIYTAIIIEPRKHKAFEYVLTNFAENLDDRWNILIFHGTNNKIFIENIIEKSLQKHKHRFIFEDLNVDNLTINDYNKLLYSRKFYDKIPTEIFLIFQTDTVICPKNKDLINKYLNYDYVGAPWKFLNGRVGNGGLSLRKKSKMIEILEKCESNKKINEDLFFSSPCNNIMINKPTTNNAKDFSIETIYSETNFGVHKPWVHLNNDEYHHLIDKCPEIDIVKNLQ